MAGLKGKPFRVLRSNRLGGDFGEYQNGDGQWGRSYPGGRRFANINNCQHIGDNCRQDVDCIIANQNQAYQAVGHGKEFGCSASASTFFALMSEPVTV